MKLDLKSNERLNLEGLTILLGKAGRKEKDLKAMIKENNKSEAMITNKITQCQPVWSAEMRKKRHDRENSNV